MNTWLFCKRYELVCHRSLSSCSTSIIIVLLVLFRELHWTLSGNGKWSSYIRNEDMTVTVLDIILQLGGLTNLLDF